MKTISATGELLVHLLARVDVAGRDRYREQYSDSKIIRLRGADSRGGGETETLTQMKCVACRKDATDGDQCRDRRISSPGPRLGNRGARRNQTPEARLFTRRFCGGLGIHEEGRRACRGRGSSPRARDRMGQDDGHLWTHKIKGVHRNDFIMAAKRTSCISHNRSALTLVASCKPRRSSATYSRGRDASRSPGSCSS